MKITWEQHARNHWSARLGKDGPHIEVIRHPSWRSRRDEQPFRINVLGITWLADRHGAQYYEFLDDAKAAAERIAKKIVRGLAKWAATGTGAR